MLFVFFAASAGQAAGGAEDAEAELARAMAARNAVEKILQQPHLKPEQLANRQEWLLRQFPASEQAAEVVAGRARACFEARRWQACVATAESVFTNWPTHGIVHGEMAYLLTRIVQDKTAPDEARLAALRCQAAHGRHCAWTLMVAWKSRPSLKLSAEEQYRLAWQAAETCGVYPYTRQFLWAVLEPFGRSGPPQVAVDECERFLRRFGTDSAESIAARVLLLQSRQRLGDQAAGRELSRSREQEKQLATAAKTLRDACDAALADGAAAEAVDRLEAFRRLPARAVDSPWWPAMLKRLAAQAAPDVLVRAYRVALDCLSMG
jgi:hypothetical protein